MFISTADGTQIFYKDWGHGAPVIFSHGWPLSADAWEDQMVFLASHGYRCIAHDRRSHGRSSQPWNGHDMDTYAADLATLMDHLDVKGAVLVGHSTGGGEVARYIGHYGRKRVAKAVLIGSITPLMMKTPANLRRFDLPTLIIHGGDDQIVPIAASAEPAHQIVKGSILKIYPGAPHGLCSTHKEQLNADLLRFLKS